MERKRTAIWRLSHGTKGMFKTTGNLLTTLPETSVKGLLLLLPIQNFGERLQVKGFTFLEC